MASDDDTVPKVEHGGISQSTKEGEVAAPAGCTPLAPVFPVRYALSKKSGVGGDLEPNYPALSEGDITWQYGIRLSRQGYIYVYDEESKKFYMYEVKPNGLIETRTWTKADKTNAKYNERPKGERVGKSLKFFLVPVSSKAHVAYSTGLWSWRQIEAVHNNKEGLRDKIMQPLDMKGWITSKKAKHTFHADELGSKVEELKVASATTNKGGPDLAWSEYKSGFGYPSSEKISAVSPLTLKATDIIAAMKTQAKVMGNKVKAPKYGSIPKETSADALCCFAFYDPVGIAADLTHQGETASALLLAKFSAGDYARKLHVAEIIDELKGESIKDLYTEAAKRVRANRIGKTFEDLRDFNKKGGSKPVTVDDVEDLLGSGTFETQGNLPVDISNERGRLQFLSRHRKTLKQFDEFIVKNCKLQVAFLKHKGEGSFEQVVLNGYDVELNETLQDLRAVVCRGINGLQNGEQGKQHLRECLAKPVKESLVLKALVGPSDMELLQNYILMPLMKVSEEILTKILEKYPASQATQTIANIVHESVGSLDGSTSSLVVRSASRNLNPRILAAISTALIIEEATEEVAEYVESTKWLQGSYKAPSGSKHDRIFTKYKKTTVIEKIIKQKPTHRASQMVVYKFRLISGNSPNSSQLIPAEKVTTSHLPALGATWAGTSTSAGLTALSGIALYASAQNLTNVVKNMQGEDKNNFLNLIALSGALVDTGISGAVTLGAGARTSGYLFNKASQINWGKGVVSNIGKYAPAAVAISAGHQLFASFSSRGTQRFYHIGATSAYAASTWSAVRAVTGGPTALLFSIGTGLIGGYWKGRAEARDPNTVSGWIYRSIWGTDGSYSAEEENEGLLKVVYTPHLQYYKNDWKFIVMVPSYIPGKTTLELHINGYLVLPNSLPTSEGGAKEFVYQVTREAPSINQSKGNIFKGNHHEISLLYEPDPYRYPQISIEKKMSGNLFGFGLD